MKEKVKLFMNTLDEEQTVKKRELFLGGMALTLAGMLVGFMAGTLIGKGITWSLTLLSHNGSSNSDNKASMCVNQKGKKKKHKNK